MEAHVSVTRVARHVEMSSLTDNITADGWEFDIPKYSYSIPPFAESESLNRPVILDMGVFILLTADMHA